MSFDRIKPPDRRLLEREQPDPAGRGALFSATSPPRPTASGLVLHCSRCERTSPLDASTALRSAIPLFLVAPWRRHPFFAVCPAGGHRAWLRVQSAE